MTGQGASAEAPFHSSWLVICEGERLNGFKDVCRIHRKSVRDVVVNPSVLRNERKMNEQMSVGCRMSDVGDAAMRSTNTTRQRV